MGARQVHYVRADIYQWIPHQEFDFIFLGFWLSHVPPARFEMFWSKVNQFLAESGRIFFLDSLYEPTSTAGNHQLPAVGATTTKRQLNDGREFEIIKVFYRPSELSSRLRGLGWEIEVKGTATYFLYGSGGHVSDATGKPLAR
jgi:demethylmenaquinone methyltransferase/2-methoxy-6-polyprenyl-1,4-benzoquinol methylase